MALGQAETMGRRGNGVRQTLGVGLRHRGEMRSKTTYGIVDHVRELCLHLKSNGWNATGGIQQA